MHALQLVRTHTQKGGPCTPPSPSCKCTLAPKRAHTLKTFPHFFFPHPRSSYFQRRPCQHSTETQPHLTASKSALQFSLQCKASLFPYEPALHRRAVSPQLPPCNPAHLFKITVPKKQAESELCYPAALVRRW